MNPTSLLQSLRQHQLDLAGAPLGQLFSDDPLRFERFSLEAAGLFLDYSKNYLVEDTLNQLIALARSHELPAQIEALFTGQSINTTEHRPALHTALRDASDKPIMVNGVNVLTDIRANLRRMEQWTKQLPLQQGVSENNTPITDIVHIGIGGSHLGPLLVCEALSHYPKTPLTCHFVASVDASELDTTLKKLNPQTTVFVVASKTFTTQETLATLKRAKKWLAQGMDEQNVADRLLATTAHPENALCCGILPDHILPLWDWVGGRYSLWSSIGLPIALQYGMATFNELLAGAYAMDQHFRTAPLNANMPVLLGLLSFWYASFFNAHAQAVLPYDYNLRTLPRYLQQLVMESNGKRVQKNGQPVDSLTAPIIFGEIGTNGQHSFHQLLLQGTHFIPCDFIATLHSSAANADQTLLLSHCFAQSRALMLGKSATAVQQELMQRGLEVTTAAQLAQHKAIPGNQPSNTLLLPHLNAHTLGALLALYEHSVFVQGVLWNINSFDQWGVELGKNIANDILATLQGGPEHPEYDGSTRGLMRYYSTFV